MLLWWWLGLCVLAGCVFTMVSIAVARSRQKRPAVAAESAQLPATGALPFRSPSPAAPVSLRRVGSGVLVGSLGKLTASWPLMVLELNADVLTLRMRPALLARVFGARPVRASTRDHAMICPASGWFRSHYVGIRAGGSEGYFRAPRPEELLGVLEAAGFTVTRTEQKITYP